MFLPVFLQNFLFSVERIKISGIAKRTNVFSTLFHKDIEQKSSRRYERDEKEMDRISTQCVGTGRNGSCSCICFGDAAGDLGDAGSGNASGSYACRDGFRGGELCSGWTERQLSGKCRCGIEIRKEACKQGVQDPRDPNRKLTMSDYVPVKWSSDLEYIARVRAAEASVYMDHQRPNGTMCFSQASPNGVESWGEVLAWNNSNDMITGIDQWYGEKQDWVKQTGGVTGHYTSMINPNNLYVGLATFICPDADFKNTTSGEFSFETGLDEGQAKAVKNKVQKIQVQNQDVKAYMEPFKEKLASSKTVQAKFYANYRGSGFYQSRTHKLSFEDTVEWSSSNPKVAAVDEKGVVTGVSAGTAKITAKCGVFEESRTIRVTGDAKVRVKKITGVPKKKTLKKGKKWSIKAKATPKNVAKLTYKSSDKKVASVNGKGVVKAKKNGKATITIKAGSLKKTCKITVK